MYVFVTILLPLVGVCFAHPGCDPSARVDCGYYGISEGQCTVDRECCWNEDEKDVPWCFYDDATTCFKYNVPKFECGYVGITEKECTDKGCCWQETSENGTPWCFKSAAVAATCDDISIKTDCGSYKPGINKEECEAKGCCWQESDEQGIPWCFHHLVYKL
jgi:hypothetical protein